MKLLLENWRDYLGEGTIQLPTTVNAKEKYELYRANLTEAIRALTEIREMFQRENFDVVGIDQLINNLQISLADDILQDDVETF